MAKTILEAKLDPGGVWRVPNIMTAEEFFNSPEFEKIRDDILKEMNEDINRMWGVDSGADQFNHRVKGWKFVGDIWSEEMRKRGMGGVADASGS